MSNQDNTQRSRLKGIDLFGQPITLTYQGKDKFATSFGGVISLVLLAIMGIAGVSHYLSQVNSQKSFTE